VPLPAGAQGFRVGQGDVSPEAVTLDSGLARVYAPFAPGLKQFSYSYTLPESRFPLAIPLQAPTSVLEVLLEDPTATATAARLTEVNPVSVEGRNFKRFLAQEVPANAVLSVTVPTAPRGPGRGTLIALLIGTLGAAMLLALARAVTRRPAVRAAGATTASGAADAPSTSVARLAREIADLDAQFARGPAPADEARDAYQARRAELKARLADALAQREGGP
jgi:hypothetical protein